MHYRFDATIPWEAAVVHEVLVHRTQRLAAYLHGVDEVIALPSDDGVRHRWLLEEAAFPVGLGRLLPDDARGFEDHLRWEGLRAAFSVSPLVHADAVHFAGTAELRDEGYDCILAVRGDFRLQPGAIERLPEWLRGRGADTIERAVVSTVRTHLTQACRAIDRLLDDEV